MTQFKIDDAIRLAVQHHQAGRLANAEQIYRQVLAQQPNHADALHLLGVLAGQARRYDIAVELIRRAIAINTSNAPYYGNLGKFLLDNGQHAEAITACRQAIRLKPDYAEAHNNLGNAMQRSGKLDDAIASYQQAIRLKPDYAEAHFNQGTVHQASGQLDEAIAYYRQAIRLKPDYAAAYYNQGIALQRKGQFEEAIAIDRQAIRLKPDYADAYNNLGIALADCGRFEEAITSYRRAIELKPNYATAHNNLGVALQGTGQIDEAIGSYRRAIEFKTDYAETHNNLGDALKSIGQLDQAIAAYRQAIQIKPDLTAAHSNLVYALHFHPEYDAKALLPEHQLWDQRHARRFRTSIQPHDNNRSPDRRLKIGYVSPDFRVHPVGLALLPLLEQHDHQQFEIICFSDVRTDDAVTGNLRTRADRWHSIARLTDLQVAQLVREEQIDLLIDLTLHMQDNRLLMFARKPAPVQITYLGYPSTTGLGTIDYRLTDPYLDPPGDDSLYVEQTVRLPETYLCWRWSGSEEPIGPLPATETGHITFGSLNNFAKVTPKTLELWGTILSQIKNSRLILRCPDGQAAKNAREILGRQGISDDRIELVGKLPWNQYVHLLQRVDIALDPFPYCGHTTSCDALWMGVPVITLAGPTAVSRGGVSILSNLGLTDLVAPNPIEYVRTVANLADDLPRLAELRRTLRQRMQASPLMDAPRFARNIEAAYRQMWRTWCATP
jgi:protein O-GlcNAc transferase